MLGLVYSVHVFTIPRFRFSETCPLLLRKLGGRDGDFVFVALTLFDKGVEILDFVRGTSISELE